MSSSATPPPEAPRYSDWHVKLREALENYFSEDEIQTLCFDLGFDYESLPDTGKPAKIIELIKAFARLGRITELIDYCGRKRPNVPWAALKEAAVQHPLVVDREPAGGWAVGAPERREPAPAAAKTSNLSCVVAISLVAVAALVFIIRPSPPFPPRELRATATPLPTETDTATSAIQPEDCLPYNPGELKIVDEGQDGWLLTDGTSRMLMLDNEADAQDALALARRYTARCFVGRDNQRSDRTGYIVDYWTGSSGLETTIVQRDCIPYQPDSLQIVDEGTSGWLLTDGQSRVLMLDNQQDAQNALILARRYTQRCYIGRGNKRPDPGASIVGYWE